MNKKTFLLSSFFLLFLVVVIFGGLNIHKAKAGPSLGPTSQGNVFGWAWGATSERPNFGVGWIKFNSCDDLVINQTGLPGHDGIADPGSCGTIPYGVHIEPTSGNITGYAWAGTEEPQTPPGDHGFGWVSFNRIETGSPPQIPGEPDPGVGILAKAHMNNGNFSGRISGWARFLAACGSVPCTTSGSGTNTGGWTGWIHLSDSGSSPSHHPSPVLNGSGGVTYNRDAGTILGYAWGSEVLGWIKFVNVTFGAPIGVFDYNLSNSGDIYITAGESGQSVITRVLASGAPQPVAISVTSSFPVKAKISTTLGGNNPCLPTCDSNITFNVDPTAPAPRVYSVEVTGTSNGLPNKTTSFNLHVEPRVANILHVICSPQGMSPYLINKPVTWQATVLDGSGPHTADWEFINLPANEVTQPGRSLEPGPDFTIQRIFSKIGKKTAKVTVTDSTPASQGGPLTGICESSINVVLKETIIEK